MKKVLENIRKGDKIITLPEWSMRDDSNNTDIKIPAITEYDRWSDFWYPRYMSIGASIFTVKDGRLNSVPSLSFDAKTVEISNELPTISDTINAKTLPPKRIGVEVPMSTELVSSMSDMQLMSFVKAGVHAVHEEILKNLFVDALDKAPRTAGTLSASGLVTLEKTVNDEGQFFGGARALTNLKGVTANGNYLITGDVHNWARSFTGMSALGSKKILDESIIGFGNFKFSAVLLYGEIMVLRDDITRAKYGDTVFTFFQLANTGIIDPNKFATTVIASPTIVSQPLDVTRSVGDTIILSVQAYGSTSIVWKKNGVIITDDQRISGATTNKITILNAEVGDGSTYTIELTNLSGTTISSTATVTIS